MSGLVVFLAAVTAGLLLTVVREACEGVRRCRAQWIENASVVEPPPKVVWFVTLTAGESFAAPEHGGAVRPLKDLR